MQTPQLILQKRGEEPRPPIPFPLIKQYVAKVNYYSRRSHCSVKVAYIFVDFSFKEIAYGINGTQKDLDNGSITARRGRDCELHAEEALEHAVKNLDVTSEGYAIGNFSPCMKCVPRLKKIGVKGILFTNLFWDIQAIDFAHKLNIDLWFYHDNQLFFLTPNVIAHLSKYKIKPIVNHVYKKKINDSITVENRRQIEEYIITHREELKKLLNTLLVKLLVVHQIDQGQTSQTFCTWISKILSQIDTEQTCLRWAQSNMILRKAPW